MKIRYRLATAAVLLAGVIGGIAASSAATATTPTRYEVVTATSVATPDTWVAVTGPYSLAQAQAKQANLFQHKLTTCKFVPATCSYTFTIYQLTKVTATSVTITA